MWFVKMSIGVTERLASAKMSSMSENLAPEPWDRQPGESARMYMVFRVWLDAAYPDGVAGRLAPRPTHDALSGTHDLTAHTIRQSSHLYNWAARALAYDHWVASQRRAADLTEIEALRREHLRAIAEIGQIAALNRKKLLNFSADPGTPCLSARDLLALQESQIKHERLLTGQATEHTRTEVDLERCTTDDLKTLADILERAKSVSGSVG